MDITRKQIFVGGDTTDLTYDFSLGSTAPLKLYSNFIDPNNPPTPTDPTWTQIVDVSKLKEQNELPITSTDTTGRTAVYDGKPYILQNSTNPAVRDDFAGKVAGSTVVNPNKIFRDLATTLMSPSAFVYELTDGSVYNGYGYAQTIDNNCVSRSASGNGSIPQLLLSFDLIRIWEDKFGLIPVDRTGTASEILARQVAWLKGNAGRICCNPYMYGVCPTGNKVNVKVWDASSNAWSTTVYSNTNSSPALTTFAVNNTSIIVDSNGMCHFLVYTDPASTTNDKILVLTGNGLSANDIILNTTQNKSGIIQTVNNSVLGLYTPLSGQQAGDSINKYHLTGNKVSESETTPTTVKITGHGLSTGDFIRNSTRNWVTSRITVVDTDRFTCDYTITGQTAGDTIYFYKLTGTQTAESTVIPSTVYLDYASIELQYKIPAGYDVLVPSNPRRDAGQSNILLLEKVYNSITTDYTGKVAGSVVENANVAWRTCTDSNTPSLLSPSANKGDSVAWYAELSNSISSLNGMSQECGTKINLSIPQHLFSFNIIAECERKWTAAGIAYPYKADATVSEKVAWYRANVSQLAGNWYGYGSKPGGNKAYLVRWDITSSSWSAYDQANIYNTTTSPSRLPAIWLTSQISRGITSDGFVHFLAYTDASDGVTASTIFSDYISLQIDFVNGNKATLAFTGNSVELESLTSGKAPAYLVECDLSNIANALYGGSNASLKSAFKALIIETWLAGCGTLNGSVGYGTIIALRMDSNAYTDVGGSGIATNVTKVTYTPTTTTSAQNKLLSNNKMYILIRSQYPSDATVPSSLSLDYISIKVQLARIPDVVTPKQVNLPKYWAMVVQGFSPCWDSSQSNTKEVFSLYKDSTTYTQFRWDGVTKAYRLMKAANGVFTSMYTNIKTYSKSQIVNCLVIQSTTKLGVYLLQNTGTVENVAVSDSNVLNAFISLYLLKYSGNDYYAYFADAFARRFTLIDLDRMGWQTGIPDDVAEQILRGTYPGFTFPIYKGSVKLYPNNKYHVEGEGALYANQINTRTVKTGDIILTDKENRIELTHDSTIQLKM